MPISDDFPHHESPEPPNRQAALIQRALAHIEADLAQDLSAAALADRAAMSRHHFHRVFQAYMQCSVGSYVTWRRLQRAWALLVSGQEPVQQVAQAVGYHSAQALAKALQRVLGTTPTALRSAGDVAALNLRVPWAEPLLCPPRLKGDFNVTPTRYAHLHDGLVALTATARGVVARQMTRAARQAFGELEAALGRCGLFPQVASWLSLMPDDPQGPDDPDCRYVAAVLFGHDLASGQGQGAQPPLALSGSLAWQPLAAGRHAVFSHIGPYDTLHQTWAAVYRDWLPTSGEQLRDDPPMEVVMNNPQTTPPELLHTEIWIPLSAA